MAKDRSQPDKPADASEASDLAAQEEDLLAALVSDDIDKILAQEEAALDGDAVSIDETVEPEVIEHSVDAPADPPATAAWPAAEQDDDLIDGDQLDELLAKAAEMADLPDEAAEDLATIPPEQTEPAAPQPPDATPAVAKDDPAAESAPPANPPPPAQSQRLADEQELDAILAAQQAADAPAPAPATDDLADDQTLSPAELQALMDQAAGSETPQTQTESPEPSPADGLDDAPVMSLEELDEMLARRAESAKLGDEDTAAAPDPKPIEGSAVLREIEAVTHAAATRAAEAPSEPAVESAEVQETTDDAPSADDQKPPAEPEAPLGIRGLYVVLDAIDRPFAALSPRIKSILGYVAAGLFMGAVFLLIATLRS